MRLFFIMYALFVSSILNQALYAKSLTEKIDTLIEQKIPHATVGVLIKDAKTGQILYSKNANKLLYPASGTKLFTAAAALYQLKPDYRFYTKLSQKGQNYYITFGGSPSLSNENLVKLLMNLNKNQIITGDIIVDASRYKSPNYGGGTSYDDLGWYYSAPTTAAILNENALDYDFVSSDKPGQPVQINSKLPANKLNIINELITVSKEDEKEHCSLNIEIKQNNTLRIYGCMAQADEPKLMKLAIPHPISYIKEVIKEMLAQNEIQFKGRILSGNTPNGSETIAKLQSNTLTQIVAHMLQESDNLYANILTKELGFSLTKEGTYKQGIFAIKQILSQHSHLDMKQIELADGAGTRYNLITPEQIVTLLTDLYQDKELNSLFMNSLSQSGVSGTLKDRMKKTILEKRVFAKTGTMHDISSLSGYLTSPNKNPLIFSIIINGLNTPIGTAKSLEEQILLAAVNDDK